MIFFYFFFILLKINSNKIQFRKLIISEFYKFFIKMNFIFQIGFNLKFLIILILSFKIKNFAILVCYF
jgi:hypothetical protein